MNFLDGFASDEPASYTHPSTVDRLRTINTFLSGASSVALTVIDSAVRSRRLPSLTKRFQTPSIDKDFDNIRPYEITDSAEVHGLMEAGWHYMEDPNRRSRRPWSDLEEHRKLPHIWHRLKL